MTASQHACAIEPHIRMMLPELGLFEARIAQQGSAVVERNPASRSGEPRP